MSRRSTRKQEVEQTVEHVAGQLGSKPKSGPPIENLDSHFGTISQKLDELTAKGVDVTELRGCLNKHWQAHDRHIANHNARATAAQGKPVQPGDAAGGGPTVEDDVNPNADDE